MSKVKNLEQKIKTEKLSILKEKYALQDELEQIQKDKFDFKRKGDIPSLDKAVLREREIKSKLKSLENRIPSLEAQLKQEKQKENAQKAKSERIKKDKEKQRKTKKQMNAVLRYMRQGKTRPQAAVSAGIPLSRIAHWYNEGKQGIGKDNIHFYHELSSIEKDCEKQKSTKQKTTKVSTFIKTKMQVVVSQMNKGKSRAKAADYAGVSIITVNNWFNLGKKKEAQEYVDFYNEINSIESEREKRIKSIVDSSKSVYKKRSKSSNYIKCPKCGKWYNKNKDSCPHCIKSTVTKSKTNANSTVTKSKTNTRSTVAKSKTNKSNNMVICQKCGKEYNKFVHGDCPNCKKSSVSKPIINASNSMVTCSKCGKKYNKKHDFECPHCKKSTVTKSKTTTSNMVTCSRCGKKYNRKNNITCPNCSKSTKSSATDSSDTSLICILALIIIFTILGFLFL